MAGVVDGPDKETPEARRAAIAASEKPLLTCVDFIGNCGRHTLITPADILGGNYDDDVVERATKLTQEQDREAMDVDAALAEAQKQIDAEKAKEAARRAKVRVGGKYVVGGPIDAFRLFGVTPYRERGWERGKEVTAKMRECLERQKLWQEGMNYSTARQLLQGMGDRREKGLCTFRQAAALAKRGLPTNVSFEKAHEWMDKIAGNGWQVPENIRIEANEILTSSINDNPKR